MKVFFSTSFTDRSSSGPFKIALCLCSSAFSLMAREPVAPARPTMIDSYRAFRQQLKVQELSPEQRIATMDAWQKVHGSPIRAATGTIPAPRVAPVPPRRLPRTPRPGLSAEQQSNAAELEALDGEFADAIREMHSRPLKPAERIRVVDEFWHVNQEALSDQRALHQKLTPARVSAAPVIAAPKIPASPEESRKAEAIRAFQALRETWNRLPPAERIAAMDREAVSLHSLTELLPARRAHAAPSPKINLQP